MDVFIAVVVTLIVAYVVTRYLYNRKLDQLDIRHKREYERAFTDGYDGGYESGYEQRKRDESRERAEKSIPKKN